MKMLPLGMQRRAQGLLVAGTALMFAFLGAVRPGDARAQPDIGGDWIITMGIVVDGWQTGTTCLTWVVQEGADLDVAITCRDTGGGTRMAGTINEAGAFQLVGYSGRLRNIALAGVIAAGGDSLEGNWSSPAGPSGPLAGQRPAASYWGDADCNGRVDSIDALQAVTHSARLPDRAACYEFADVNIDGIVDPRDAMLILQHHVGLINHLPLV